VGREVADEPRIEAARGVDRRRVIAPSPRRIAPFGSPHSGPAASDRVTPLTGSSARFEMTATASPVVGSCRTDA